MVILACVGHLGEKPMLIKVKKPSNRWCLNMHCHFSGPMSSPNLDPTFLLYNWVHVPVVVVRSKVVVQNVSQLDKREIEKTLELTLGKPSSMIKKTRINMLCTPSKQSTYLGWSQSLAPMSWNYPVKIQFCRIVIIIKTSIKYLNRMMAIKTLFTCIGELWAYANSW